LRCDVLVKVKPSDKFPGVYFVELEGGQVRPATVNLAPGVKVYGENLIVVGGVEYRVWDPFRSKLAASILKGLESLPIKPGLKVLYLGVASGTTASHVSDIVGPEGFVYGVEFAPRVMREFISRVCEHRSNVAPILADARMPALYSALVQEVDVIYQDVAQPDQGKILVDNARMFLARGGWTMLAVKARSVNVAKEPSEVYRREVATLREGGLRIEQVIHLEPYDVDHAMIIARYE